MNRYLAVTSIFFIILFTSNILSCELSDISEVKTLNQLVDCDFNLVSTDESIYKGDYYFVYHFQKDYGIPGFDELSLSGDLQNIVSCILVMDDLSIEMCFSPGEPL